MARVPPPKRKQAAYGLLKDYEKKKTKTSPKTRRDVNGRLRYVGGSNAGQLVSPSGRLSDRDEKELKFPGRGKKEKTFKDANGRLRYISGNLVFPYSKK